MMRRIEDPARMQRLARQWRAEGVRIGLVPTMGYLHAGHLSLVTSARQAVGPRGRVVVSIYVNPTQFAPNEDLSRYPRDAKRDLALCRGAGADVVFMPGDATMYPGRDAGRYSNLCGGRSADSPNGRRHAPDPFPGRHHHRRQAVQPGPAGCRVCSARKDWQQAAVVGSHDPGSQFPLELIVAPTVREPDGLAMSSRNKYLDAARRAQAVVLWESLEHARHRVLGATSGRVAAATLAREITSMIGRKPDARLDYVEFFDPATLESVRWVVRRHADGDGSLPRADALDRQRSDLIRPGSRCRTS
jgi:pantoate--beta-alanine ligase